MVVMRLMCVCFICPVKSILPHFVVYAKKIIVLNAVGAKMCMNHNKCHIRIAVRIGRIGAVLCALQGCFWVDLAGRVAMLVCIRASLGEGNFWN